MCKTHISSEHTDMLQFQQNNRALYPGPRLPQNLLIDSLSVRLRVYLKQTLRSCGDILRTAGRASSITVAAILPPEPDSSVLPEDLASCYKIEDGALSDQLIAAFSHFRGRGGRPFNNDRNNGNSNNHARGNYGGSFGRSSSGTAPSQCAHAPCGQIHVLRECCLCRGQAHPIDRCWHIIGLPDRLQNMANTFKQLHGQNPGPRSASPSAPTSVPRAS
jgi:hypothetical protein